VQPQLLLLQLQRLQQRRTTGVAVSVTHWLLHHYQVRVHPAECSDKEVQVGHLVVRQLVSLGQPAQSGPEVAGGVPTFGTP